MNVTSASLHSTMSMATEIPISPKRPPIVGLSTPGESVPSRVWTSLTNRLMRSPGVVLVEVLQIESLQGSWRSAS